MSADLTELEATKAQLAEANNLLASLKEKTKAFVQKQQKDHEDALAAEKAQTQALQV